jgi:hypothetical protein
MKIRQMLGPAAVAILVAASAHSFADNKSEEAQEKTIQMSKVPQPARDAAQKTLGTAPTEAKIVSGTNPQEYELEGKDKAGKEVGVHVLADGTVVKTENEHQNKD